MDFSDDVAYSVHDFEDAVVNGYIKPEQLGQADHRAEVLHALAAWDYPHSGELRDAWDRLESVTGWLRTFTPHRRELANLKNLTSTLIGRFAEASAISADGKTLVVSEFTWAEIAVLKGIVQFHVMTDTARQPLYLRQRAMLIALADAVLANPSLLDAAFGQDWELAGSPTQRKRVVVDQIASLTDQSATTWFEQLVV